MYSYPTELIEEIAWEDYTLRFTQIGHTMMQLSESLSDDLIFEILVQNTRWFRHDQSNPPDSSVYNYPLGYFLWLTDFVDFSPTPSDVTRRHRPINNVPFADSHENFRLQLPLAF